MKNMKIFGLTGTNAAGKGEAAKYLQKKGFSYFSLSDVLREEMAVLGIEPTRDNLIKFGNGMRKKFGPNALAIKVKPKLKSKSIVDSIRNVSEIKELRKIPGFKLIAVDAPIEVRFERAVKRNRIGDAVTLKDFIKKEKKEYSSNPTSQQLLKCMKEADIRIINGTSLADLHKNIKKSLKI